ncbi:hypothetical protein J437_LFUL003772 [Ladona fulva]|uniref:Uncharacterized protein n=1 Tax=Ladona fulva TaxID=123851 RepID=A0A8K0NS41_LADFU|nr:hypothetical protein J437_LFUL003772 [Ladona fulva]
MSFTPFNELLVRLESNIRRQNTQMRDRIQPEEMLALTIRSHCVGLSLTMISFDVSVCLTQVHTCVPSLPRNDPHYPVYSSVKPSGTKCSIFHEFRFEPRFNWAAVHLNHWLFIDLKRMYHDGFHPDSGKASMPAYHIQGTRFKSWLIQRLKERCKGYERDV